MIIQEKLDRPYDQIPIREKVWLRCDYCGIEFQRVKKNIGRLNAIVAKDSCAAKDCSKKKRMESCIEKYGCQNVFQSDETAFRIEQTNLEKYGTKSYFSSKDFEEKRKATLLSRYGVESPLQNDAIRHKQQETTYKSHGVMNYAQSREYLEKVSKTNQERYGAESPMGNADIVAKRRMTNIERYGKESYTQTKQYWDQREANTLDRYGVRHTSQLPEYSEKMRNTCLERYGVPSYSQTEEFKERFRKTCMENFGVLNPLALKQNQKYGKTQEKIGEWLNSLGFNFSRNHSEIQREIDLYDPDRRIGIEYCGLYWHTELSPTPRLSHYHAEKYQACANSGIRLFTIFEDEWKLHRSKCESIIKSALGIYERKFFARKCQIKEIAPEVFRDFCDNHHLLGSNNLGCYFVGIFHQDELLAGMSIGRHHRNQNAHILDRFCVRGGVQVVGGASRLLNRCLEWASSQNVKKISTWSDHRWSNGAVYEAMGFQKERILPPDYSYVDLSRPTRRFSKQSQMKSNTNCPPGITEKEWCAMRGLARIWDCGKTRWSIST